MKKTLTIIISIILVCGCIVGGTIAWLVDQKNLSNTFTVGNINITLDETLLDVNNTVNSYKIVPGNEYAKDTKVTVIGNSEDCWLFIKVTADTNVANLGIYQIAEGWTQLDGESNVWYRKVDTNTSNQEFKIFLNDKFSISSEITKAQIDAIGSGTLSLEITAYAIQYENLTSVGTAWNELNLVANS